MRLVLSGPVRWGDRCSGLRNAVRASMRCLLLWAALPNAHSFASAPPRRLVWEAAAGCPTAADVRALMSKLRHDPRKLAVRGLVRADGSQLVLELHVSSDSQHFERTLRSTDCQLLAQSAVWLIDLASEQLASATTPSRARTDMATAPEEPHISPEIAPRSVEPESHEEPPLRATPAAEASSDTTPMYLDHTALDVTHDDGSSTTDSSDEQSTNLELAASAGLGVAEVGLTGPATDLSLAVATQLGTLYASVRLGTVLHPALELGPDARVSLHSVYAALTDATTFEADGCGPAPVSCSMAGRLSSDKAACAMGRARRLPG